MTKKTILSFLGLGGLALALVGRFLPWESRINLSQLESKAKNVTLGSGLIDVANADTPGTSTSGEGDSSGSSGGDCDEGSCT